VRLDREVKTAVDDHIAGKLQQVLEDHRDSLAGIILQDYNKGVITPRVIQQTIAFASAHEIPVHVDPKFQNFFEYRDVTLFKPNRKETQDAIGFSLNNDDDVIRAGQLLLERLGCSNVLITLGSRGMMLFERTGDISSVATKARHVADVSGAGDTVIATIAAAIAGGAGMREAAALANVAAGVVCAEPGIIAISPQPLLEAVTAAATD
jgi:rfaE bifunctional protein kinase chain/domain